MVSVGGNYYSVPDTTRRRLVEAHSLADEGQIYEDDRLIARHGCSRGADSARCGKATDANIGLKMKTRSRMAYR